MRREKHVTLLQPVFLILIALLLLAALVRRVRTPRTRPEYRERVDTVWLLLLLLLGQGFVLARERQDLYTPGWWIFSFGLLPITVGALCFVWRLFGAYRQSSP